MAADRLLDVLESCLVGRRPLEDTVFSRRFLRGSTYQTGSRWKGGRFGVFGWPGALMASTFSGLGCTPSALNSMPKNVIVVSLIWHLSKLKTNPCCCATNIRLCKFASCSFSVGPCTATSSAIPTVPGHFSRKKSIFCWKTSWLTHKKEDG